MGWRRREETGSGSGSVNSRKEQLRVLLLFCFSPLALAYVTKMRMIGRWGGGRGEVYV